MNILYLNDSKQLSAKKREELYDEIMEKAEFVGVGLASENVIDEINVLQANYQAMRMAIHNLPVTPDVLLNDAVTIPEVDILQVPIIKGDTLSISIAAASIIAKVTRDKLMVEYDKMYPEYDFASNKGYGFVIPDKVKMPNETDVFIPPDAMMTAMHHDRVVARVHCQSGQGKSRDGEIIRIVERANPRIVGTFEASRNFGFVTPDDVRLGHDILLGRYVR